MKPSLSNHLLHVSVSAAIVAGLALSAKAADGTWTQSTSGGLWNDTTNWSGGTIATDSGFTANFNTLDLAGDHTVSLDADRTLTSLTFGDTDTATAGSWLLDNNTISTNNLILAGTTPTLTVNALGTGKTATISALIEGTAGLTKSGVGKLTLSGANSYTGTTILGQGALAFGADQSLSALTLGAAAGSTEVLALDLTAASATVAGTALVRTNNTTANTATIGSGKTLTLNGGLTMGYDAGGGSGATASNLTISGSGSLAINGGTINIGVQQAANNQPYYSTAILDLTALGTGFSTNVTNFNIGVSASSVTSAVGTVLLSNVANTLVATSLTVGKTGTSNAKGSSSLVLGTGTNVLQVDTLTVGSGKGASPLTGLVQFAYQTAGSAGTVSISNKAGTGAANIIIADNSSTETTSGNAASGILDLRGHVATVNAGNVRIGRVAAASNVGSTAGTLSFDAGTFTVDTLNLAPKTGNGTGTANATVNVGGGSFTVNTGFALGSQANAGKSGATLNLTGGVFTSNVDILDGGGTTTSTINLNGGTLDLTGHALGSATVAIDALNFNSGTLKNVLQINNGAALTKATAGTLILDGSNNYSGPTNVTDGKLVVNGNISTSSLTTVSLGATLGGSGTVGAAIINGTLAPGNSPGTLAFTSTLGINGATVMEIDGTAGAGVTNGHDFVNLTGAGGSGVLTYGGALTLDMGVIFSGGSYSWNLFDFASETGTFATIALADQYSGSLLDADLNGVWDLASGNITWQFTQSTGALCLVVVPEPNAAMLVGGLGMLALLRRRREG
jgi:MYXO-CTERM domain-containing protein